MDLQGFLKVTKRTLNVLVCPNGSVMLQDIHDGIYDSCHLEQSGKMAGKFQTDNDANSDVIGVCAINSIFVIRK